MLYDHLHETLRPLDFEIRCQFDQLDKSSFFKGAHAIQRRLLLILLSLFDKVKRAEIWVAEIVLPALSKTSIGFVFGLLVPTDELTPNKLSVILFLAFENNFRFVLESEGAFVLLVLFFSVDIASSDLDFLRHEFLVAVGRCEISSGVSG